MAQPFDQAEYEARLRREFPYERFETSGANAWDEWQRLCGLNRGWPVIVGNDEDFLRVAESVVGYPGDPHPLRPVADILHAASQLEHPASLQQAIRAEYERYGDDLPEAEMGQWPREQVRGGGLTVPFDVLTGQPHAKVHIVVLPTQDAAEAPAYLRWGGWNACPHPEYHVAALRAWRARYGVELIALSGDVMNLKATRRPATRVEAIELAREHYLFCNDVIDQGVGTLSNLAAILMSTDWWYFWWD